MKAVKLACLLTILGLGLWLCTPAGAQEPVPDKPPQTGEDQEKPGEKKKEGEAGQQKKEEEKEKDGEKSQISLKDGSFLIGRLDVEEFEVDTAYGRLVVPKKDVLRIRIGKAADKELKKRIEKLIGQLGDEEFEVRNEVQTQLRELGRLALTEIREATNSEDGEIRHRAEELIKEIEALPDKGEYVEDDDEVAAVKFTIRGTLLVEEFVLVTHYATLTIKKKDIKSMVVHQPAQVIEEVVVTGADNSGNTKMKDAQIDIRKGDKIIIKASGSVYIRQWGYNVKPDGREGYGEHYPGITAGALMGKIGNGSLFTVGSSCEKTAERDGKLYLGIAIRDRYSNSGEFRCKVEVQRK